jgi:hypothetical protein
MLTAECRDALLAFLGLLQDFDDLLDRMLIGFHIVLR